MTLMNDRTKPEACDVLAENGMGNGSFEPSRTSGRNVDVNTAMPRIR